MGIFDKVFKKKGHASSVENDGTSGVSAADVLLLQTLMDGMNPERKDALFRGQRPEEKDYGYSINNPICTASVEDSKDYLACLKTFNGESLCWLRTGAISLKQLYGVENVVVDEYQLFLNGSELEKIYICPYGRNSEHVPNGFIFGERTSPEEYGGDLALEAQEMGFLPNQLVKFKKLQYENDLLLKEQERKMRDQLYLEEERLRAVYPYFRLDLELENDIFAVLIDCGINMRKAYEYIHCEELLEELQVGVRGVRERQDPTNEDYYQILIKEAARRYEEDTRSLGPEEIFVLAEESGMTEQQYIEYARLRQNDVQKEFERQKSLCKVWADEAVVVKRKYPGFNLENEYKNELFKRLIDRVEMINAYELIHFEDLYVPKVNKRGMLANESVEERMGLFCRKCGTKLPGDSEFCYRCGEKVILLEVGD